MDSTTVSTTINILDSVTVTTNPSGLSITVDNVPYTAPQTFNWVVGSSHTIGTTSPQNISGGTEQVWSSWSDNGAISHLVAAPLSATTYIADFNAQYQLTTVASPGADGSVTPPPGGYYASGATIPVTATANSGFQFNNWTSTGGSFDSTTAASTNFHMPAAPATVTGNFIPATVAVTITTSPANLLVSADGGTAVAAPLVETWAVGSTHTIATTSPQAGAPGVQYVWSNWNDSGAISHTITVPSAAPQYLATFNTQYQLTTAANPSIGGTVSPTSGGYYTSGTVVPLTATANAGYSFTNWTGNVANSTSASTTITMTAPQSVTANFSLIIVAASTTTSVSSSNDPSFTVDPGSSVTFTATVSSTSTVNEGTVTFSDTANDFTCSGGNTVPVSNGTATCTTSFSTEGSRNVTATYSGTVNFQTSNGFVTQTVNNHTVVTGNQFCNQGAITVPSTAGAATPYPSNIFVTGLSGSVGAVTVQLNGISSSDIAQTDLLLVGPTGAAIVPFAAVGDGSTISDVNVTLDDTASSLIPGGSPLTSGTYKPTSITGSTTLVFPAPAPAITAANYAATDGAATLTSEFVGTAPNGTWALYAIDNAGNGAASIGGGWCVNITPATAAVTVTKSVTSAGPYNTVGQVISYSFVAKNTGNVTLSAVGITDTQTAPAGSLTSGPTCQSLSSPPGSCSGSTTTLLSGQSATFTAIYTITQADLDNGSVNDSATASGTPPTGPPVTSAPSTATVTTTSAPAVTVTKSVTSTGPYNTVGQVISYSFVARNTGNVTLHAVGITDIQTAPAGSLTSGPTCQSLSSPTGTCSGSTTTLLSGQSATFTATYTITQADLDNGSVNDSATASGTPPTGPPVTSTPSTATVTLTPTVVQITITTSPAALLVSVDGGTATAAPLVENWVAGSTHTIATTSPQAGGAGVQYVWSYWNDSGAISHRITVPSSGTTYTATFNTQYQLTMVASPSADGSVTPVSGSYYAGGAIVPVTATANAGFQFTNWTSTGGSFVSTTSPSTNFTMPSAPATVTGNFASAAVSITITTSPANLLVSEDGGPELRAPFTASWAAGSTHTITTTSPQAGGPGVQYVWSSWSDSGAISHTITVPGSATTYTATFNTQYQLTTAANPSNGGTVSPTSGTYYAAGTVVPLMATPNTGYAFTNWTGPVANPGSASTTVTMSAPETVTANFSELTTTGLMSSQNPSTYGQSVTFTATITSSSGATPTGTVSFENGTGSLVTIKLVGGSASLTTSTLSVGSHTITAYYNGSTKYATSSSALSQTVDKAATTTTITNASPSPSTYGQPVTFTATVSTTAGSASGNVEFKWGALRLGSGMLSGGSASYTTTATQIPGGEDAITAVYNGDVNHAASTSAAYTQTVNKEATTTLVITSGSPSTFGSPVTFTATVSASVGTPAGNVAFTDGTTLLGTMALSGGTAQFTTSALAVGTHIIHADYHGNGNDTVSSGKVTQVVQ